MVSSSGKNQHVLVVDDNESIHEDIRKILAGKSAEEESLLAKRKALFGGADSLAEPTMHFDIVSAYCGEEGVALAAKAMEQGYPFSLAFIDVRMPPGLNGAEAARQIWKLSPETQIVMCTSYSDGSLDALLDSLEHRDRLVILKKPFDNIEVLQLAYALTEKWDLMQKSKLKMDDLTEKAEARARELKEANAILEAEIECRKLTAKKLDEARRLAEAALEARGAFLANMSHEIRTPLNGIMGMNELMSETPLTEEQRDYSTSIQASSQTLLCIINDILDFSKIDAGKLEIVNEDFCLSEILDNTLYVQRQIARRNGLKFIEMREPDLPDRLRGDANRMKQVLSNLLSNAIKFTHEGNVTFQLERVHETESEVHLKFIISDTGIGIEKAVQGNLFQPFTQADSSTTRNYGGTGLGLAICKNLVGLMQGEIDFESDGVSGSRFWFTIPFGKTPTTQSHLGKVNGSLVSAALRSLEEPLVEDESSRILVAEDSPIGQELIRKHLQHLGFNTTVVANGKDAVDAVCAEHYDLVMLDCEMPVMDGFEAAIKIRGLANGKSAVPIVALTAHTLDEARDQCLAAGMNDYLTKPINQNRLKRVLAEHLVLSL